MAEAAFFVEAAWRAVVAETARFYRVRRTQLGAVRAAAGRNALSAPAYRDIRKVAVYVTVLTADCSYAALARVLGMHRDTITSQCEDVRALVIDDPMLTRQTQLLEERARARLMPELAEVLDRVDEALAKTYELAGETEPPEWAARRRAIRARISDFPRYEGARPTGFGAGFEAELIKFPLLAEGPE